MQDMLLLFNQVSISHQILGGIMLRFIGAVVVVAALVGGFLFFGGYMEGDASVGVTNKGHEAFNNGVSVVQDGVNDGLDSLKTKGEAATKE
jgi:hypothetical protein